MTGTPNIGLIPDSSIRAVAADYPGEEHDFALCIRLMDAAYREEACRDPGEMRVDKSRTFGPDIMRRAGR